MENCDKQNAPNGLQPENAFAEAIKAVAGFMRKELIFRGILFLILGLLMLFRPGQTLIAITIMIGVFILIDGIFMLIPALKYRSQGRPFLILNAVFFILLGLFSCTAPLKMNIIWVIMIGFWQLVSGIQCLTFRNSAGSSAILSGVCGIIAGVLLIFMPVLGMLTLMWVMGILSFLSGLSAILLGIRLKKALN